MKARLDFVAASPATHKAFLEFSLKMQAQSVEPVLQELVKIRASQLNGCAFCLHIHTRDARKHGETEERLYLLDAWRESPLYTPRERAALAWTEALTLVSQTHAPDADYAALREQFSEEECVKLTMLIGIINAWNRFAIGFRAIHPVDARAGSEAA